MPLDRNGQRPYQNPYSLFLSIRPHHSRQPNHRLQLTYSRFPWSQIDLGFGSMCTYCHCCSIAWVRVSLIRHVYYVASRPCMSAPISHAHYAVKLKFITTYACDPKPTVCVDLVGCFGCNSNLFCPAVHAFALFDMPHLGSHRESEVRASSISPHGQKEPV